MIMVFSKDSCPFCEKAKNLLRENGVKFEVIDVTNDEKYLSDMRNTGGTVPRIWDDNVFVGGYSELEDYLLDQGLVNI